MNQNIRVFYTSTTLSWGFIVRYKEVSAAQPSYILPPPTTIVGAFSYPLARILGLIDKLPENKVYKNGYLVSKTMKTFLESTIAASAGVAGEGGLVMHQELSKIHASIYKDGSDANNIRAEPFTGKFYGKSLPRIFPVQAVGATYAPGVKLYMTWVLDVDKLLKNLRENGVGIGEKDLDSAAQLAVHGVTRIGSKEGIVAVDPDLTGYERNPEIVNPGGKIRTIQYVPSECVDPEEMIPQITLPYLDYSPRLFYIPSASASNILLKPYSVPTGKWLRVKHPCKAYAPREFKQEFTSVGL
ncbi:CRISPR-associated protein Cas5 [Thermosphaera sp.]